MQRPITKSLIRKLSGGSRTDVASVTMEGSLAGAAARNPSSDTSLDIAVVLEEEQVKSLIPTLNSQSRLDLSSVTAASSAGMRTRFEAATRAEAIYRDHAGAALDPEFQKLVARADAARDVGQWGEAEYHYWRGLELYPLHSGYRVQYAHVIKEQGKLDWAEVHYRSAIAEGVETSLVDEHLLFVARRNGADYVPGAPFDLAVSSLDVPPSFYDIQTLAWLFWHDAEINAYDALALMRNCETNRQVVLAMTNHDRFVERNRPFLEILRG